MAHQYTISPVIEDGGVPLLNPLSSGGLTYAIATSSSTSSGSEISEPPAHSASQSLVGSDISSPPPTYDLNQQALSVPGQTSSTNPYTAGQGNEDSADFPQAQTPMLGIIVPFPYSLSPVGDVNEDHSIHTDILHLVEPAHAPETWSMESPSSENIGQEGIPILESNEETLADSPPTPNAFPYHGANMLTICQDFHPTLRKSTVLFDCFALISEELRGFIY